MRIKHLVPTLLIGVSSVVSGCGGKTAKVAESVNPRFFNDKKFTEIVTDTFSQKMSDCEKVIEFNKLLKKYNEPVENYIIIDKKNCRSTVYSPDGDILDVSEVALGKNIGDKRSGGYGVKGAKLSAYTTPGEFEIVREG